MTHEMQESDWPPISGRELNRVELGKTRWIEFVNSTRLNQLAGNTTDRYIYAAIFTNQVPSVFFDFYDYNFDATRFSKVTETRIRIRCELCKMSPRNLVFEYVYGGVTWWE